jgi:hypothetical protein
MKLIHWLQPEDGDHTIANIQVLRARTKGEAYVPLTIFPARQFKIVNNVSTPSFVTEYLDEGGDSRDFYKVVFIDKERAEVGMSGPFQGSNIYTSQTELLYRLRHKISDTAKPYVFSDWELYDELNQALLWHSRTKTWEQISQDQSELILVLYLAIASVCRLLAVDNAKYYSLSVDGKTVNPAERSAYYKDLANQYKLDYTEKKNEWQVGTTEREGEIKETYLTRMSLTTGRRVASNFAERPKDTILFQPTRVTPASVDLNWSQCLDPEFYYYMIFRSHVPNQQTRLIVDAFNKRIALMDDPIDYQTNYLWGGITAPVKQIFRAQVTEWVDKDSYLNMPATDYQKLRPGTIQYYVILAVNRNLLISVSNEMAVQLPMLGPPQILDPVYASENSFVVQAVNQSFVEVWKQPLGVGEFVPFTSQQVGDEFSDTYRFLDITINSGDVLQARQTAFGTVTPFGNSVIVQ